SAVRTRFSWPALTKYSIRFSPGSHPKPMSQQARLLNIRDALAVSPPLLSEKKDDAEDASNGSGGKTRKPVQFSLFYFDGTEGPLAHYKYRLLVEGAKFSDEYGFTAVWTPERHFHEFGGLYLNPDITS